MAVLGEIDLWLYLLCYVKQYLQMKYIGSKKCFQFILVITELFLGLRPANERWHNFVTKSLIDWVQA